MLARLIALALMVASPAAALAQADDAARYPSRPVKIIVPFPAGGTTDIYARVMAEKLQASLGQPFVVENKGGATGIIGTGFVANSEPDGYTLLFGSNSSHVISSLLQAKPPFDPLADFRPISMLLNYPLLLLVNNEVPAKNARELVALAKARPGTLNMGSIGTGSGGHLTIELFKSVAGINTIHVPYRGVPAAQMGLVAGEIQFLFDSIPGSKSLVEQGRIRAISITGNERSPIMPELPTLKEEGFAGLEDLVIWLGMLAPAKTPDGIVKKLEAEMQRIARLPDIQKRIQENSANFVGGNGQGLADFIRREIPVWTKIIKDNDIRATN